MKSHPQEDTKQAYVKAEVDGVTAGKSKKMPPGGLGMKGIVIREEVVAYETEHIADDIGDGGSSHKKQQIVYSIMESRRKSTHYSKSQKLS